MKLAFPTNLRGALHGVGLYIAQRFFVPRGLRVMQGLKQTSKRPGSESGCGKGGWVERSIGLMGAFREEIAGILRRVAVGATVSFSEVEFTRGVYAGKEVVLSLSGIGREKASRAAQLLVENFPIRALIFLGIAGALHPSLRVGDIVIGKRIFLQTSTGRPLSSDERLVELAGAACDQLGWNFFRGDLITVPKIIASSQEKREIYQETGALAVEMETAAAARWAAQKRIPFLALRSISDAADYTFKVDISQITGEQGELNLRKTLRYLLSHPTALWELARMKGNVKKATGRLEPIARAVLERL